MTTAWTDLTLVRGVFVRSHRLHHKELDMNHSPASIRDQSEHPTGVLWSQRRAMLCLVVSWILGTCIFETLSWGQTTATSSRTTNIPNSLGRIQNIAEQWRELETEISLANSGIDNFVRVEENHRIRPSLVQMIRNEQTFLAMRESMKSLRRAPANVKVDPDVVVMDPIMDSMHIAKKDVTEAYRKLDESREASIADPTFKQSSGLGRRSDECSSWVGSPSGSRRR